MITFYKIVEQRKSILKSLTEDLVKLFDNYRKEREIKNVTSFEKFEPRSKIYSLNCN